jgi:tRNA A-37 threonylcarbamoyl transferase component Bud32
LIPPDSPRLCTSCATPIPGGSAYCPACGTATPTEISLESGTARRPAAEALDEAAQRRRLEQALGESFQLGRLLGRGGFAEVYAATDLKLQRTIAVKVLRPDLVVSHSLVERFVREARAAAKLRHPNIIPIYQVGEVEGLAYYLMPLIEGESLRACIERTGPLPFDEARRILREVAEALAAAHEAGLVHRDIKPDNIMLEGRERRAIVTDFGIAKALGSGETGLTGTGLVIGTPQYMSPEQASAEKEIDHRSDVYSLGVVAFHMLTGHLPFETDSARELVISHITAKPPDLRSVRPDVPDDLADAVAKCLRKKPADRWATAGELAAAIRPAVTTPAGGIGSLVRRLRPLRRRAKVRVAVYFSVLVLALAAIAVLSPDRLRLAWAYWTTRGSRTPQPAAVTGTPFGTDRFIGPPGSSGNALVSLGDTLLLVESSLGGAYAFDGSAWHPLGVPGAVFPPIAFHDTLLVATQRGSTQSVLYALTPQGPVPRDTIPHVVATAWSDGRTVLLGSRDGAMLRGRPGQWRPEPTGTTSAVELIWGSSARQFGIGFFARPDHPDSLMVFNGLNWRVADVRPDSTGFTVYNGGFSFPGGRAAVVGKTCTVPGAPAEACHALVLLRDSSGERWRPAAASLPVGQELWGIWGKSSDDYYVFSHSEAQCTATNPCFLHVVGNTARPVEGIRGGGIIGVAGLRGVPYALTTTGALWTLRDGEWGVVSEMPGSLIRGVAAGPWGGDPAWPGAVAWGEGLTALFRGLRSGWDRHVRDVAIVPDSAAKGGVLWILSDQGALFRISCARQSCGAEVAVAVPDRRRLLAVAAGADGRLRVGGERGLVAVRTGQRWQLLPVPAGVENEDVVSLSWRRGRSAYALTAKTILRVDSGGALRKMRDLDPAQVPGRRIIGMLGGGAVVLGAQGAAFLSDGGEGANIGWFQSVAPTGVEVLDDGRVVLGYATPDDPLLGGRLWVAHRGARGWSVAQVQLPPAMDVYGLAAYGNTLYVVGSGWSWLAGPLDKLPFAPPPPPKKP